MDLPQIAIIKIVGIQIVHVILVNAQQKIPVDILNVIVVGVLLFHQLLRVRRLKWADTDIKLRAPLLVGQEFHIFNLQNIHSTKRLENDLYGNV